MRTNALRWPLEHIEGMKENADLFAVVALPLATGISSSSSIETLTLPDNHSEDRDSGGQSGPVTGSNSHHHTSHASNHHHHHHASKTDHFRRLEDRMDALQEQMASTQQMIHELTGFLQNQQRSATTRQNFRTLSGKALAMGVQGPTGATRTFSINGPSSSTAIATSFLSALDSKAKRVGSTAMDNATAGQLYDGEATAQDDSFPEHKTGEAIRVSEATLGRKMTSKTDALMDPSQRKISASNPLALISDRAVERRTSASLSVAYASMSLSHAVQAASTKALGALTALAKPSPVVGPEITRRFSISTLNQMHGVKKQSRANRVAQWSRNLFRPRVEPAVSIDDIQDARTLGTKVHRFTIRHDSRQRVFWDTLVILLITVDIVITPLSLSFHYFPSGIELYNALGNVIFAGDFIVNMFSSYTTSRGELISGPSKTVSHYFLSAWALPDILSWFPFEIFFSAAEGRFLGIAKVIRLAKVSQLARRFHSAKKAGFFRFIRLFGIVFIVSHCLSCYWNWVASEWRHQEDGYLAKPIGQQYAHCWAVVVGCLNASPPTMHTTIEEVSVAVFMLIGNVVQATVFGSVAVLISSFDEDEVAYNKKLISTYERCHFLGISEPLARRIQGYYENLYRETRSVNTDADSFINELSPALICEVKFQLYRDMLKQIPFLSATHINPVVIEMLILHLRTVIYMQDDVLIRKGEFGDWMGFIGSKGSVGVLDPNSDGVRKIIRILRKGDYFGEMSLLQRAKRSTTAIALSWVQIHVLCRNDLDDVKDQYPEQAQILEEEINKYMKSKVVYK